MRHRDAVREQSVRTDRDTAPFDLSLETREGPTQLGARFEYETAARFAGFLVNAAAPDVVRLAPALTITAAQLDTFVAALPAILDSAKEA